MACSPGANLRSQPGTILHLVVVLILPRAPQRSIARSEFFPIVEHHHIIHPPILAGQTVRRITSTVIRSSIPKAERQDDMVFVLNLLNARWKSFVCEIYFECAVGNQYFSFQFFFL